MSPTDGLMRPAEPYQARVGRSSTSLHREDQTKRYALKRSRAGREACHPIPIGETVSVIRIIGANPLFTEGRAIIRASAQGRHRYRVQFLGDPVLKERFVHPGFQHEPERVLAMLIDVWRAGIEADANFSDFFPEDI